MRRLAFAALLSLSVLPALALAQTTPPATPAAPAMGPGGPPPGGCGPHGKHDKMAKWHSKFDAANTTHDGHLTLAQAQAAGMKPLVDHFAEIDAAKRGYVTFNEVQAWRMDDMAKRLEAKAAQLRAQD
jgi:hypothetical protein